MNPESGKCERCPLPGTSSRRSKSPWRRRCFSTWPKQSTTSLSLKVEKDLLKEVDDLKKQRKILAQHSALAEGLDGGAGKGDYDAQIKDVNDKLTKVKTEMEKHQVSQYT